MTTYSNIGEVHRARRAYAEALTWYEKSGALAKELGDNDGLARSYNNIGLINHARGAYDAALTWCERGAALYEELGNKAGLATTLHNMGAIANDENNLKLALDYFKRSRDIYASIELSKEVADEEQVIVQINERLTKPSANGS